MTASPVRLTLGPSHEIAELEIDRHEMRYGGDALAGTIIDLHARAFAAAQREREREFAELGVPNWFLTPGPPTALDPDAPGAHLLGGMRAFLDTAAAATGTGTAAGGRVRAIVSVYGDLLELSLPAALRTIAPPLLCAAIVEACARATDDAAGALAAARDELRRSLTGG